MDTISITPTPPYAALIFDCDGTLANTIPVHVQTWMAALRSLGADLSQEWLYERRGMSAMELIQTLNSTFGYEFDATVVNTDRQRRYRNERKAHVVYPWDLSEGEQGTQCPAVRQLSYKQAQDNLYY